MKLLNYMESVDLTKKSEVERAKFLCFYHFKENNISIFTMTDIAQWFEECNFNKPNTSRLKSNLIKGRDKAFLSSKGINGAIEFVPTVCQMLERDYGCLWIDTTTIESNSELIEEVKFCNKRSYLDKLIRQINLTYGANCYDACAVLMRRLFEVLLVLSYQNKGIEADISKPDGTHKMLESIVKDAVQNKVLGIPPRISKNFDSFRDVGNNSAHSITYTAGNVI